MAYEIDTATDYLDLLARIETFAAAQGWTVERSTYDETNGTDGELILSGPGLGGGEAIIVGMRSYKDTGDDHYNWALRGWRHWEDIDWDSIPDASTEQYLQLWNDSIPYWLICNGQRILLVAKVSTYYMHAYLGFVDTYSTDTEHPYPLLIGGASDVETVRWSNTDIAAWWSNDSNGGQLYMPDGTWMDIYSDATGAVSVWPWSNSYGELDNIRDSFGEYPLFPVVLFARTGTYGGGMRGVVGEVDGLYYVTGFSLGTEDLVSVGATDYLVAQNVFHTERHDYCAVELS